MSTKSCESCGRSHDGSYATGRFCNRSCANARRLSRSVYQQISEKLQDDSYRSVSDAKIIEAVKMGHGMAEVVRLLGLKPTKLVMTFLKERISTLELSTTHFTNVKRYTSEKLSNGPTKRRLPRPLLHRILQECNRLYQCELCSCREWKGDIIQLEIHHVDQNNLNNHISNLQYLCPNCHSYVHNALRSRRDT